MAAQATSAQPKQNGTAEPVKLGSQFIIDPGQPLPALASGPVMAFAARDLSQASGERFALIANDAAPPRTELVAALRGSRRIGLLPVIEGGVVDWPLEGRRRYAVIFERPAGARLMTTLDALESAIPHERLLRNILAPAAAGLADMAQRGLFHGSVRPTNMFYSADSGTVTLGECIATPPSFTQPVLFEPADRGMAEPIGRGSGSTGDDHYALGVSALILLLGGNPLRHLSDAEVIEAKVEKGSFGALVGAAKLPAAFTEALRGLLNDDSKQRWGLGELTAWLGGQRLSPKSHQVGGRNASRSFAFEGAEFFSARALAHAFSKSVPEALKAIEGGELERWLRMSAADNAAADRLLNAIAVSMAAGKGDGPGDRLVARVCIALDPTAPIRYKGRAVMPSTIGSAIAAATAARSSTQELAEIIAHQLPVYWYNAQPDSRPEYVPLAKEFSQWRMTLARPGFGSGVERVLYELDRSVACLSPIVSNHYVQSGADMLRALEAVAGASGRPAAPMDRHIAAFLIARDRRVPEGVLGLTAETADAADRAVALLNIFGAIQERSGPKELPKLCGWLATLIDPVLRKFHSKALRERLKGQLKEAASTGRIAALQQLVDDPAMINDDLEQFENARNEYNALEQQIVRLRTLVAEPKKIEHGPGREAAGICSAIVAMIVLTCVLLMNIISPGFGL